MFHTIIIVTCQFVLSSSSFLSTFQSSSKNIYNLYRSYKMCYIVPVSTQITTNLKRINNV